MKRKVWKYAAIVTIICICACSKEDDNQPDLKTQLLTTKTWKLPGFEDSSGGVWVDSYAPMNPCSQDDELKFTADRFTLEQGPTKCNPDDPQIFNKGDWHFIGVDKDYISMDFDGPTTNLIPVKILTLNNTTFKFSYWIEDSQWNISCFRRTYTAL